MLKSGATEGRTKSRSIKWLYLALASLTGVLVWGVAGMHVRLGRWAVVTGWTYDPAMSEITLDGNLAGFEHSPIFELNGQPPTGHGYMLLVGDINYQVNFYWNSPALRQPY